MKKISKRQWLNLMITICFTVFAIVLCYLVYNFNIDTQDQKQFDDMAQTLLLIRIMKQITTIMALNL